MLQLSNLYGKHHPVSISCLNEGGSSKHLKCIELILFLHPFLKESKVNDWYLFLEPMFCCDTELDLRKRQKGILPKTLLNTARNADPYKSDQENFLVSKFRLLKSHLFFSFISEIVKYFSDSTLFSTC